VPVGPIERLAVQKGDVVSLVIGPRDANHSCDLTRIDLSLTSLADAKQAWNLAGDVSSNLHAGNPHADRFGNSGVWHFYSEPIKEGSLGQVVPAGSLLAKWQAASDAAEKTRLAEELQKLLVAGGPADKSSPDGILYQQLASLGGPLLRGLLSSAIERAAASPAEAGDARLDPPHLAAIRKTRPLPSTQPARAAATSRLLPADLAAGCELVTSGHSIRPACRRECADCHLDDKLARAGRTARVPIVARERAEASASIRQFRQRFPAALCYARIVPVVRWSH
jgi:hypothetical protein